MRGNLSLVSSSCCRLAVLGINYEMNIRKMKCILKRGDLQWPLKQWIRMRRSTRHHPHLPPHRPPLPPSPRPGAVSS